MERNERCVMQAVSLYISTLVTDMPRLQQHDPAERVLKHRTVFQSIAGGQSMNVGDRPTAQSECVTAGSRRRTEIAMGRLSSGRAPRQHSERLDLLRSNLDAPVVVGGQVAQAALVPAACLDD